MDRIELSNFKEFKLFPAIYSDPNRAFRDMDFKFFNDHWGSRKHRRNGDPDGHGAYTTQISAKYPGRVRDWSEEDSVGLIDWYMEREGKDFFTALKELADLYGLELPSGYNSGDAEKYERWRKNVDVAQSHFHNALWSGSEKAKEVMDYLLNVRHWTTEKIQAAKLGLCTTDTLKKLDDIVAYASGIGVTHVLSLPYENGGRMFGHKFRKIDDTTDEPKYLNSTGLTKSYGFFNMPYRAEEIVIVEGELDALNGQVSLDLLPDVKGRYNIVATAGGAASRGQLEDASRRGVKKITLLYDNDDKGDEFTESTYKLASSMGFKVFVACLDDCKDSDEYLGKHETEEYKSIIDNAEPSYLWNYYQLIRPKYADQGGITDKQRADYADEVCALALETNIIDRERLYAVTAEDFNGLKIDRDDFREWVAAKDRRRADEKRTNDIKKAVADITAATENGDIYKATQLIRVTADKERSEDNAEEYAKVLSPKSPAEVSRLIAGIKDGIPTGYYFSDKENKESFTLNAGLTFICGNRAHGKTSLLNNIAINVARRNIIEGNGQSVLYFSQEIGLPFLFPDLINTYVNCPLISANPRRTIVSYYKGFEDRFFKEDDDHELIYLPEKYVLPVGHFPDGTKPQTLTTYDYFLHEQDIFMEHYIKSGALIPIDEAYKAERILDAVKTAMTKYNVSIVCIDYAQLLYSVETSRLRTEEIKKIVNDIKDFANKAGIPFVLAAQFNRDVHTPLDVDTNNIGEGGDFERIADTCVGIFSLKELKRPSNFSTTGKGGGKKDEELIKTLQRISGLEDVDPDKIKNLEPINNKIYVRLMKRRYGPAPIEIALDWEGKTKYITPNDQDYIDRYINRGKAAPKQQQFPFKEDDPGDLPPF
ncbi:MAG: toprim domain-containing protein [Clostridia bacterium]|nr:toprim domain-containing protein [Clostridia bacterium]